MEAIASAIPVRHMGELEELAALVTSQASERAGHIIGTTILVDGGRIRGIM
jgi:hypothetical protein